VSCPDCDQVITLPEHARAGDTIDCGGRRYRLTFEYGAFAAEPVSAAPGERCGGGQRAGSSGSRHVDHQP
jgi:hypothetical protein